MEILQRWRRIISECNCYRIVFEVVGLIPPASATTPARPPSAHRRAPLACSLGCAGRRRGLLLKGPQALHNAWMVRFSFSISFCGDTNTGHADTQLQQRLKKTTNKTNKNEAILEPLNRFEVLMLLRRLMRLQAGWGETTDFERQQIPRLPHGFHTNMKLTFKSRDSTISTLTIPSAGMFFKGLLIKYPDQISSYELSTFTIC